jgi:hypothetical protein
MVLPWHRRTRNIVLLLIFFFPVGLVLLWRRSEWSVLSRSLVTAAVGLVLIVSVSGTKAPTAAGGTPVAAASNPTAAPVAPTGAGTPGDPSGSAAVDPSASAAVITVTTPAQTTPPAAPAKPAVVAAPPAPAHTSHAAAPPKQAPPPPAAPSTCGAPNNPYGYNFCSGSHIYNAPGDICDYFSCIANFSNGTGYMEECKDGTYSMSGGKRGACSDHGGEERAVLS